MKGDELLEPLALAIGRLVVADTVASPARVVAAIRAKDEPGWGARAADTVRRFGENAAKGDFIWTRDL